MQAYDEHLNLMLSKVEETIIEETPEGTKKETTRTIPVVYMRGDTVIGISPLEKPSDKLQEDKTPLILS